MDDDRLSVKVANELPEVPRVVAIMEAFCAEHRIPEKSVLNLCLVLDEILTNIISYAFDDGARHDIEIAIMHDGTNLDLDIIDDGHAFDPLQAPSADTTSRLEDRSVGGLGIHLVKTLMDTVRYRREENRNHLYLRKVISESKLQT